MWFLFGEVFSSSGSWDGLRYIIVALPVPSIYFFRTKIRHVSSVESRHHAVRPRKTTRKEDIDNVTSFRRNRFLSRARIRGLVRNATGTRICAKTVQRRLKGVYLR